MKTSFSHSIACSLLVQPFSVKPQRQWGHSGEGGNQRSSGLSGAAPLWMTKGFIVSPEAEVDSSTEHQPVEPLASDRGGVTGNLAFPEGCSRVDLGLRRSRWKVSGFGEALILLCS